MAGSAGYREVRGKLGFFGWLSRLLLAGWQILMINWFITYTSKVSPMVEGSDTGKCRCCHRHRDFLDDDPVLLGWRDRHSRAVCPSHTADESPRAGQRRIGLPRSAFTTADMAGRQRDDQN